MALAKSRMQMKYEKEVRDHLHKERGYSNVNLVPTVSKIVLNVGVGEGRDNPKALQAAVVTLTTISGQQALVTKARKSISNFKIRDGMKIGCMVTLRGHLMWHFLDRLVSVVLPRMRDFQGISVRNFDGRGNYNLGLRDQMVFPEINFDEIEFMKGMQISIITSANDNVEAAYLLAQLGMPFNDFDTVAKVA